MTVQRITWMCAGTQLAPHIGSGIGWNLYSSGEFLMAGIEVKVTQEWLDRMGLLYPGATVEWLGVPTHECMTCGGTGRCV